MLILKLQGGLGNQMFQYAFIKALALYHSTGFKLDISEYQTYFRPYELEIFAIDKNYAKKEIPRYEKLKPTNRYLQYLRSHCKTFLSKRNPQHHQEQGFHYDVDMMKHGFGYFEGYFQSEKYFAVYEKTIREDFRFIKALSPQSKEMAKIISQTNSVSIHIRRGDYLKANNLNCHGICGLEYYQKAVAYLKKKEKNLTFFFFSDDIARVKEHFQLENSHFIDRNQGKESRQDMQLMSLCQHNIIANSSFSWRGARLNAHHNKIVIAPQQRFATTQRNDKDVIPKSWIRL